MYDHFLVPNNVDHMEYKADRHLCDTYYHGDRRNWNFEKYVTVHKEQHHILKILEYNG